MTFELPAWSVMASALAALVALAWRWRIEHRSVLLVKFFPSAWLAILYAGVAFHWFPTSPAPSPVSAFVRFTFCMILLAQAFTDYMTAREIARLRGKQNRGR